MESIIRALGSPLAHSIISTSVGLIIGALAAWIKAKSQNDAATGRMLRGLGHDRITYLGMAYIKRGYITKSEYENLITYLWEPYHALNGNGTAARVVEEVESLPLRDDADKYLQKKGEEKEK